MATFFLLALFSIVPSAVYAQDAPDNGKPCYQDPLQVKCNQLCWTQAQCKEKEGIWEQNKQSEKLCGEGNKEWGHCYPHDREVTLQVPIGEVKEVTDVGKYIKIVYLFGLGIAGLVAVIMFIHAGLQWMVSGGNSHSIEAAKTRIRNVAIGMALLFGSYTILSAINPDLVKMRVPRAHLIRNVALEFAKPDGSKMFGECNVDDPRSISACQAACPGCQCIEQNDDAITIAAKVVSAAAVAVVGSTVFAGTAAAQFGGKVLQASAKTGKALFSKLLSFCTQGVELGIICALGATATVDDLQKKVTSVGVCIPPASNLEKGEICAFDGNCKSGKCLGGSREPVLQFIGVCADGTEGSPCEEVSDCSQMPEPEGERVCAKGPGDTKWCTTARNRKKGSPCEAREVGDELSSECGLGLGCQVPEVDFLMFSFREGIGWCVDARIAAGGAAQYIGDGCGNGCPGQDRFEELGYLLQCLAPPNEAERCTRRCTIDSECAAGCPAVGQCSCSSGVCAVGAGQAQQVQVLQNGAAGCENQALRRCADGLQCVGPFEALRSAVDGHAQSVCSDGAFGSRCLNAEECDDGLLCDNDLDRGTLTCIREPV